MKKEYKIFFDLDGVLVDFDRGIRELCGEEPMDQMTAKAQDHDRIFAAVRSCPGFYRKLEQMPGAKDLFDAVYGKYRENCQILSGIPKPERDIPEAAADKLSWVRENLSGDVDVNLVRRARKIDFCTGAECILIDDFQKNIDEWREHGGTGILYKDAEQVIAELEGITEKGTHSAAKERAKLRDAVKRYISRHLTKPDEMICMDMAEPEAAYPEECDNSPVFEKMESGRIPRVMLAKMCESMEGPEKTGLEEALSQLDEGLPEMLTRLMNEKDLKKSDVYKGALVSKAVFSNIMTKPDYRPKKTTLFALAVSMKLDLEETRQLLERAGYALSHSIELDVAMEYFIKNRKYNIFEINEILFDLDLPLLGEKAA